MGARVVMSKGGNLRVKRGWRRLLSWQGLMAVLLGLVLAVFVLFGLAYALIQVPSPNDMAQTETSIYYYSDGKTELARQSAVNRESVKLDAVPKELQHAVLAAEDRDFYSNPGVSVSGIGRAMWAAITGGPTQGGSTITQQYVKNYFLSHDQTLARKGRELIISIKVEQAQSKDEILGNYLNTIYFGRGAYGVQAAAQAYFGKNVSELSLSQSVFIASVLRAPSLYDPARGDQQRANVTSRMQYVAEGMFSEGWITEAQRDGVKLPETVAAKPATALSGPNGYVVSLAREELMSKAGLTAEEIERGGLRVTTTIDRSSQQAAVDAVSTERPGGTAANGIRAGLVTIKPGDGAILALYGGADYATNPYSAATQAQLQTGSTFKVFTLAAALEQGISTRQTYDGNSPRWFSAAETKGEPWEVKNFEDKSYGYLSLRDALAKSVNTIFAAANLEIGPARTKEMAIKLGLPENTPGLEDNPSNVFGTASTRVIDMANAYATIAASGVRAEPYVVRQLTSTHDRIKGYTAAPSTRQVLSADVAADTIEAMTRVVTDGTGKKAQAIGYAAAGKTGTTDENKSVWFDGFTPQAATAVALYMPDSKGVAQPLRGIGGGSEVTGGSYPLAIWTNYMRRFMAGRDPVAFPQRVGIGDSTARIWVNPTPEPGNETSQPTQGDENRDDQNRSDQDRDRSDSRRPEGRDSGGEED